MKRGKWGKKKKKKEEVLEFLKAYKLKQRRSRDNARSIDLKTYNSNNSIQV